MERRAEASGEVQLKAWTPISPGSEPLEREFLLSWNGLKYCVRRSPIDQLISRALGQKKVPDLKLILKGISGSVKCGEMTALMGPSGAGKSSLLECLIGRRKSTGQILCRNYSRVKVAYIPQQDMFFPLLTVREAMILASKLQNSRANLVQEEAEAETRCSQTALCPQRADIDNPQFHANLIAEILEQLRLSTCIDNRISACSGGQRKRLSIAQELVSRPSILFLDEPTSGLDSSACQLVIELLRKLSEGTPRSMSKMTVIVTIHQPSYKILALFRKVYMLSNQTGKCIFEGSPADIIAHLAAFDIQCPKFYNPVEMLMEVASGDIPNGAEVLKRMALAQETAFEEGMRSVSSSGGESLSELSRPSTRFPFFGHLRLLFMRSLLLSVRDPYLFGIRFGSHLLVALLMAPLFGTGIGEAGGCPPIIESDFDPSDFRDIRSHLQKEKTENFNNIGCVVFSVLFLMLAGMMPTTIVFPLELGTFVKEKSNQWYGVGSYFAAKTLADIPFLLAFPFLYVVIHYLLNGEIHEMWRFATYATVFIITGCIGQSHGELCSALLAKYPTAAVFLGPVSLIPSALLSGVFIRIHSLSAFFTALSYTSYMRFCTEDAFIALYGYDRCGLNVQQQLGTARETFLKWLILILGGTSGGQPKGQDQGPEYSHFSRNESIAAFNHSQVIENFSGIVAKQLVADFIGEDGQVRSRTMNDFNLTDDDFFPNLMVLFLLLSIYKTLTYLVLLKQANPKE